MLGFLVFKSYTNFCNIHSCACLAHVTTGFTSVFAHSGMEIIDESVAYRCYWCCSCCCGTYDKFLYKFSEQKRCTMNGTAICSCLKFCLCLDNVLDNNLMSWYHDYEKHKYYLSTCNMPANTC